MPDADGDSPSSRRNSGSDPEAADRLGPTADSAASAPGPLTAWSASAQRQQKKLRQYQEKLERHRQVGFLLQSSRRFKQIEGKHLALVISLNLFVAVIPLLILGRQGLSRVPAQPDLVIARVVRAIRCGPF